MRPQLMTNLATYGLLGTAVAVSALLPARLGPQSIQASMTGATMLYITGVVHDFKSGHPDFYNGMAGAQGHIVGNVMNNLNSSGRPARGGGSSVGYLVTKQWCDSQGNPIAPNMFGTATGDVAGTTGPAKNGGIYSAQSYDQWFADVMGANLSAPSTITLTKNSDDVWEYHTNDIHPIDNLMFGNEGKKHNNNYTYSITAQFTHHAGEHRFVEFKGDDDVWVYIDGKLAMDLGGLTAGVKQYLDVDRLSLSDGQQHTLNFFYAQRQENRTVFNLRTNLDFGAGTKQTHAVSGAGD